jgi:hypothetical protein
MRELGRKGGRAIPKARRADAQRQSLREFLRREVDPAAVWAAIEASLASGNERDRLAGAKLLLSELYEPAAQRQREEETEQASARAQLALRIEELSARRALATARRARAHPPGRWEAVRGRRRVRPARARRMGRGLGTSSRVHCRRFLRDLRQGGCSARGGGRAH